MSYGDDVAKVRRVLQEVIGGIDTVLAEPKPEIRLSEHADSPIDFTVRVWANSERY